MINFDLSPEQKEMQRMARQFAAERIIPNAATWDREESYPAEFVKEAASATDKPPCHMHW